MILLQISIFLKRWTGDKQGAHLVHVAATENFYEIIRVALDHQVRTSVDARGGSYGTTLQTAVSRGYKNIVGLLLTHAADINAKGGAYGIALNAAICSSREHILRRLLQHGVDVNARSGQHDTAHHEIKKKELVAQL
jgi:hypothetical protein